MTCVVYGAAVTALNDNLRKKPAPGIPGTVLLEPDLRCQKSGHRLLETAVFFIGAVRTDMDRRAVIHAEHSHEALGVDQHLIAAYQHPKGLDRRNLHKFLHILKGMQRNIELLQGICPPMLYKQRKVLYNVQILYQIFCYFQLTVWMIITKQSFEIW